MTIMVPQVIQKLSGERMYKILCLGLFLHVRHDKGATENKSSFHISKNGESRAGKNLGILKDTFRFFYFFKFRLFKYVVRWIKKYNQRVHKDYPICCYDERYEIIATPINSKFEFICIIDLQILT